MMFSPAGPAEEFAGNPAARPADPHAMPMTTTASGRGIFKTAVTPAGSRRRKNPDPETAAAIISEEELQWRAARVEQEANHDLRRLVTLLDLDEEQQDRIFQTLARRAADWHPLLQPALSGGGGTAVADTGGGASGNSPPPPAEHSGETLSPPDSASSLSPVTAVPATGQDGGSAGSVTEIPLTEALAPDLTLAQQDEMAEAEQDRQEWWESIIPRLLPGEEDTGDIYAVPPTAVTSLEEPSSPPPPASE